VGKKQLMVGSIVAMNGRTPLGSVLSLSRLAPSWLQAILRTLVLVLPFVLLLVGIARTTGPAHTLLGLGAMYQFLVCLFILPRRSSWHFPLGASVVTIYLIGLSWMATAMADQGDWYSHFSQALLLMVPLIVVGAQVLAHPGNQGRRKCRALAHALATRRDWPTDLFACRDLPEVKALREAVHLDADPALALLEHHLVSVRVAALVALEFHENWRQGQAEYVLRRGLDSPSAAIRAATASALAQVEDRSIIEPLSVLLEDPTPKVRHAIAEALMWKCDRRWQWIRAGVRRNLADPAHGMDGPLCCDGQILPDDAVADLHAWSCEKGILGIRSSQTLGAHYGRLLQESADSRLVDYLRQVVTDPHGSPALRIELGQMLRSRGIWEEVLPDELLGPSNPAPLRLMAIESLLADGHRAAALQALCEIASLPNREIALATADIAQRHLAIDLGLAPGKPFPPLNSRMAAEITRRVMRWAADERARSFDSTPV
jgi:hypothetical protein